MVCIFEVFEFAVCLHTKKYSITSRIMLEIVFYLCGNWYTMYTMMYGLFIFKS